MVVAFKIVRKYFFSRKTPAKVYGNLKSTAKKTKYAEMTNRLQKLMRDRLCTGVLNKDLREFLVHHFKEDETTPYTLEEQLARAKSWEAVQNTNITIMHPATSKEEEHFNRFTDKPSPPQAKCGWCGGAKHHHKDAICRV